MNFDDLNHLDLDDDPNYFELQYRLAQIEQVKGIVYVMKGKNREDFAHFFEASNRRIETLLSCAKVQKEKDARFNYPSYVKPVQAINLYFPWAI